ncbi:MAG TPA: GatB/YqeY domain-containing protein [Candidatus Limnocylindrales bacterium]|nr:GatB/YqeY domain-containing protein [Candidatus Limnocylindrales bacterium]
MTLRERLHDDTIAAMRSGDALRRDTLRMVQNAIYNIEKAKKVTLSEDEILAVVTRETKTRRESVDAFRKGDREDLAAKEEAEIAILADYLPTALTEDELRALVEQGVAETGAATARDLGKVMGWLSPRIRGRADGKLASGLVAAALARADLAAHDTEH